MNALVKTAYFCTITLEFTQNYVDCAIHGAHHLFAKNIANRMGDSLHTSYDRSSNSKQRRKYSKHVEDLPMNYKLCAAVVSRKLCGPDELEEAIPVRSTPNDRRGSTCFSGEWTAALPPNVVINGPGERSRLRLTTISPTPQGASRPKEIENAAQIPMERRRPTVSFHRTVTERRASEKINSAKHPFHIETAIDLTVRRITRLRGNEHKC
jgi:hypothetical protein